MRRGADALHAGVRACECVHTRATVAPLHSALPTAARQLASLWTGTGAERSPAACKCVCFSSPASNSIRTNCIWERGGVFRWWVLLVFFFFLDFSLKSCDGNLHIVTHHAFPAPRWAKT